MRPTRALNQTWEYTNSTWIERFPATSPLSRTNHSLVAGPNSSLYLFGGNDGNTYYNDLWKFENDNWSEIAISGGKPVPRTLAAMTYQPANDQGQLTNDHLLLFGGRTVTGTLLADLWAFDLSTETWQLLDDGGGGGPPARMGHTLTYDPALGNAVLIGGVAADGHTLLDDTWLYQAGWTQGGVKPGSTAPAYHQAVYTDNAIILMGNGEVWGYE